VKPTPAEVIRRIRRVEIRTRRLVNETLAGEYHSIFKGQGMEFSEVREYQPGDDVRTIDWNVTARMGSPFVKKFVEERELTVYILVDASASGLVGSFGRRKQELAAELGALLAFSALTNHDKVGLILFTDRVEKHIPPGKGKGHVLRIIREVLYFEPEGRGTDLTAALDFLGRVTTKRSVVFLLSDFYDAGWEKALSIVNRRHDVVALAVRDGLELDLPEAGLLTVRDLETGTEAVVDTASEAVRRTYAARMRALLERTRAAMKKARVDLLELRADEPYEKPLTRFFTTRAKRVRM
jgi:uncharacterized protein (DUF58 family)